MIIITVTLLLGLGCGMRLGIVVFALVMIVALVLVGALALADPSTRFDGLFGHLILCALGLQVGYAGGLWIRSRLE